MKKIYLVVAGLVVAALVYISMSNNMVRLDNTVQDKWGAVQSAYQRRFDLINQLVPTVQGGANQELAVFAELAKQAQGLAQILPVDAQGNPIAPTSDQAKAIADQAALVSQAVVNVKSYVADNPDIQSTALFSDLMTEVEGSENRINVARLDYNSAVKDYKVAVEMFPGSLIANLAGRSTKDYGYFNASEAAQSAPTIQFGTPAAPPPSQK